MKRIPRHIGQIGRVHAHIAPIQAVLDRRAPTISLGVAENIDKRPLFVIVIAWIGLEVAQHAVGIFGRRVAKQQHIISVEGDGMGFGGINHQSAQDALVLRARMTVIPVSAALPDVERVRIGLPRLDSKKAVKPRRAIHNPRQHNSVPVNGCVFLRFVRHDDRGLLAFLEPQGRTRDPAINGEFLDQFAMDANRRFFDRQLISPRQDRRDACQHDNTQKRMGQISHHEFCPLSAHA